MQARAAADEQTPALPYLCADADGQLPSCAPLANPYVPFQQGGSKQYQTPKALVRGTIFPGLDLPFMGKVNETEKNGTALVQIQELGFALRELGLYLDTHQSDTEATALFSTRSATKRPCSSTSRAVPRSRSWNRHRAEHTHG